MSTADIEEQIRELYHYNISSSTISRITDKITSVIICLKNKTLEFTYLIVWKFEIERKKRKLSGINFF